MNVLVGGVGVARCPGIAAPLGTDHGLLAIAVQVGNGDFLALPSREDTCGGHNASGFAFDSKLLGSLGAQAN